VRIAVQDNGSGIPATEHKRIFQKFYRVDDRLSREREGSGLGLAIVKHVMKAHRGHVEVDSGPGQGSTFTLVIPRRAKGVRSESSGSEPAPAGDGADAARRELGHG
jgi:two-component system phosphate regulon sensor histidine kinase PhoR